MIWGHMLPWALSLSFSCIIFAVVVIIVAVVVIVVICRLALVCLLHFRFSLRASKCDKTHRGFRLILFAFVLVSVLVSVLVIFSFVLVSVLVSVLVLVLVSVLAPVHVSVLVSVSFVLVPVLVLVLFSCLFSLLFHSPLCPSRRVSFSSSAPFPTFLLLFFWRNVYLLSFFCFSSVYLLS